MCNWCNNILNIKGKKEDLENFKQKYIGKDEEGKKSFLDFDKIIPTTKSEEEAHKEWLKADEKTKKRYRDEKAFWFDQFGVDWRVKHWGIKWNPEINEPHYYKDDLYYSFSTAWADPNGIVRQLIINHPELEFHLEYEEWGELFKGDLKG